MEQIDIETYRKISFEMFYESFYQERLSEVLTRRWNMIDLTTKLLIALTASGSAIAGWALWNTPGGKFFWAMIAGVASISSIANGVMGVPTRVKEQEEIRQAFSKLRVDLEMFRQRLKLNFDPNQLVSQYTELQDGYTKCMEQLNSDIALTIGLRKDVQIDLNEFLKEKEYI